MLVPCPSCRRHARGGEACPFCGALIAEAPSPGPYTRVSRAMALAAVGLAGCHGSPVAAVYGGPPTPPEPPVVEPAPSASAPASASAAPSVTPPR